MQSHGSKNLKLSPINTATEENVSDYASTLFVQSIISSLVMNGLERGLLTYHAFQDKYKAYDFERYLKTGSGKAFASKRFW